MGCDRKVLKAGNGVNVPKKGDTVIIEYTGYLYDGSKSTNDCRGVEFDSSKNHGDEGFETAIGLNRVIKGWEVGVLEMSVGERSILTISSDYAYGDLGFPGLIPPNSALVFDMTLLSIKKNNGVALSAGDVSDIKGQGQLS